MQAPATDAALPVVPQVAKPVPSPPPPAPAPPPASQPSVQLTAPRFTPAPAAFSQAGLPTYSAVSTSSGPVSAQTLAAAAPGGQCKTIGEVLAAIPEASQWLQLLKNAGLDAVLLSDRSVQATVFVPVNSAFGAGIDLRPLFQEGTLQDLLTSNPGLANSLGAYSGRCLECPFVTPSATASRISPTLMPLPACRCARAVARRHAAVWRVPSHRCHSRQSEPPAHQRGGPLPAAGGGQQGQHPAEGHRSVRPQRGARGRPSAVAL